MGYAAEKRQEEQKRKRIKAWLFIFVALLIATLCVLDAFYPCESWKYYFAKPKITARADGEMRMHFLNVGQGDATFIELPDGKTMLIDGGNGAEENNLALLRYLNALKVKRIDYLIVTHADADHCGGLAEVVKYKDIGRAFLPVVGENVRETYAEFYSELVKKQCATEYSMRSSQSFNAEGYTLRCLYPLSANVESGVVTYDANASSAVLWLDYKGVSALFTGDATTEIEQSLMTDDTRFLSAMGVTLSSTEILKVAHHGSRDSTSADFLQYLGIQTAIVSCGKNNLYGHPHAELLQRISDIGARAYRTDEQGHVVVTVSQDGNYTVDMLQ